MPGGDGVAKKATIQTVAYVHVGEQLVNIDDLNDGQRHEVATWLKKTYLDGLFQGKAKFHEKETVAAR